jgi:myosin heavy subunit
VRASLRAWLQLNYTGLVAAARVRQIGYALRVPFGTFRQQFATTIADSLANDDDVSAVRKILDNAISTAGLSTSAPLYALGATRVFLRSEVRECGECACLLTNASRR